MIICTIIDIATFIVAAAAAAIIIILIGTTVVKIVRRHWDTISVVIVAALALAALLTLHGVARADDIEVIQIDNYIVEAANNTELKISFGFEENVLAFYWEGKLDTSIPLMVTIWLPELECINAEYVEVIPE